MPRCILCSQELQKQSPLRAQKPRRREFVSYLFVYSEIMLNFAAEIKWIAIMDIKKITHEEALRRWKHSLEIKREWERKVAERWANEDQQEIALV